MTDFRDRSKWTYDHPWDTEQNHAKACHPDCPLNGCEAVVKLTMPDGSERGLGVGVHPFGTFTARVEQDAPGGALRLTVDQTLWQRIKAFFSGGPSF